MCCILNEIMLFYIIFLGPIKNNTRMKTIRSVIKCTLEYAGNTECDIDMIYIYIYIYIYIL